MHEYVVKDIVGEYLHANLLDAAGLIKLIISYPVVGHLVILISIAKLRPAKALKLSLLW